MPLIALLSSISNQAEGKKRMKSIGKVDVPQEAFMAVLKLEKEVIWLCFRVSCNMIWNCKYIKKILESWSLFVWYNSSIVILWFLIASYTILDHWQIIFSFKTWYIKVLVNVVKTYYLLPEFSHLKWSLTGCSMDSVNAILLTYTQTVRT